MESESWAKKLQLKNKIWLIIPALHWGLTFIYEKLILKWDDNSWDIFWSKSLDDSISNSMQSTILYVCGKLIAALLIYLLWKGVYSIVKHKIPPHIIAFFVFICVVSGVFLALCWPWSFDWQDTYTLYAFAVRMIPWYWHHFLTSAFYVGCLMVIPFPFAISVIQSLFFSALITYIFYKLEKVVSLWLPLRFLVLAIFVAPTTFVLVTQGYRNCLYSILCMYYVAELCFGMLDKRKEEEALKYPKIVRLMVIGAVLSVWRTEGILIGIVGTAITLICICKSSKRKRFFGILVFVIAFVILSLPQKIGDKKYYNKDYIIMSTIEGLQAVLNSSSVNLEYDGAADDLAAINAYASIDYIKQYGTAGKRGYFYENGNMDFDQSCADPEVQNGYLKAVVRLAMHNPVPYVKKQLNFTLGALGTKRRLDIDEYCGPETNGNSAQYTMHEIGREDIYSHKVVSSWVGSSVYNGIGMQAHVFWCLWNERFEQKNFSLIVRILILLMNCLIALIEIVKKIRKKKGNFAFGMIAMTFMVQFIIIAMTIPSSYSPYIYSVTFPSVILQFIYMANALMHRSARY